MPSARVQVLGGREAIKALSGLPKELRNETRKNIRTAAAPIKTAAQGNIPGVALSGWRNWQGGRLAYRRTQAQAGIGMRIGGGRDSDETWRVITLTQKNAAGAVFEMAGRRSSGNSPQGRSFIRNLNAKHGRGGRALWRAVDDNTPLIETSVKTAVVAAMRTVNQHTS